MNYFIWNDYLELNTDLKDIKTKEDAENHWNNFGIKQMRLCNKLQLNVINEFGNELILYIPYYYYLYSNNLLFDNKITTYKGMKSFYCFLDTNKHIIEKEDKRHWVNYFDRPFLVNNNEHVQHFDDSFRKMVNYKDFYKNDNEFLFDKPMLIVHNKYNVEWGEKPINFFSLESLDKIFSTLSDKYQIVYIRPKNSFISNSGYSYDENNIVDELQDYELIENKYKNTVITFNSILEKYQIYSLLKKYSDYTYNKIILKLFSNCENYICIQGGSAYLTSYFFKKMLILHIRGDEITNHNFNNNCYNGWVLNMNNEPNKVLTVCRHNDDVTNNLHIFK
jgi:hypothetical protein